jgi:hypothetical protein
MLNKLKNLPPKVLVAIALLAAVLVAAVVAAPVMGIVLVVALVLVWCINTLAEHYIQ